MATQIHKIRIGSRKSKLALVQTEWVKERIEKWEGERGERCECEIVEMSTQGDRILDTALSKIGDKGLFTKELETALLEKSIDFAVHSLKDMPTKLPEGLTLGAISEREAVNDAVVFTSKHHLSGVKSLAELPDKSCIGTSSLRRMAQLAHIYKGRDFTFKSVRGNVQTRLQKLNDYDNFGFDAIIL